MPRAIWSGSISFGLVNIPVKLYTAVSKKDVRFNQIDARTGARIKMKRVSTADGEEVPYEQIVKGYEVAPDRYVLVEPEELDALDPKATHTIEIQEFTDLDAIDPIFYDSAYYVAPVKGTEKPYALLVEAMEREGKVAIARFVMRTKEYLAAVRPKDGMLLLSTMVYADEVVAPEELTDVPELNSVELNERELAMASQLIESLTAEFDPGRYRDTYRDKVLEMIDRKAAGEEPVTAPAAQDDDGAVVDLMAALEASVKEAKEARARHPSAKKEAATRKRAAKKAPAKRAAKKAKKSA